MSHFYNIIQFFLKSDLLNETKLMMKKVMSAPLKLMNKYFGIKISRSEYFPFNEINISL